MLQLNHISKTFQQRLILNNISFQAASGKITALLGSSGSGKSTLLNIIAGLTPADQGNIVLNQQTINHLPPEKRHIAMMFQDFALLPHLNVWENAAFGLRMQGISKQKAQQQIMPLLEKVGLHNIANHPIQTLSGGEQQRTALARALAISPQALLLDEPFSSIDSTLREQLQQLVCQLIQEHPIPTLMVTHDANEACLMAQHIILFANSQIIQQGSPTQLLQHPQSPQAARLLGCLNVSEQHYIPPHIINIQANGTPCPILNIFRQPIFTRITFQHPQYGTLITFTPHNTANQLQHHIPISINPQHIIYFQTA